MKAGFERWNKAFETAGFKNAVRAADPTPDMDPMDIRHAWLLWINRDERGFSSGGGYSDPRTGEILGAKVRMDSARIRTIDNYWSTYLAADDTGLVLHSPLDELLGAVQAAQKAGRSRHAAGAGLRAEPADAPDAARNRALARVPAQLELEHEQSRVGDGVPDAEGQGDGQGRNRI